MSDIRNPSKERQLEVQVLTDTICVCVTLCWTGRVAFEADHRLGKCGRSVVYTIKIRRMTRPDPGFTLSKYHRRITYVMYGLARLHLIPSKNTACGAL